MGFQEAKPPIHKRLDGQRHSALYRTGLSAEYIVDFAGPAREVEFRKPDMPEGYPVQGFREEKNPVFPGEELFKNPSHCALLGGGNPGEECFPVLVAPFHEELDLLGDELGVEGTQVGYHDPLPIDRNG